MWQLPFLPMPERLTYSPTKLPSTPRVRPGKALLFIIPFSGTDPVTKFGQRLHTAREALGLSQSQVAEQLSVTQKAYAVWERYPVALRPEQVERLAEVLHVPVEQLFGNGLPTKSQAGPIGKARRLFETVSRLPRHQQNKIIEVVEALVSQHLNESGKTA
jgi:transcriptional regulator with XRE-family HTH domain